MPQIHPTAVVSTEAELADDVIVGPGCVIDGAVRIGSGTKLLHRVTLQGPLILGTGNTIYPNAAIGMAPQDLKFDPATPGAGIEIGNENIIREGVTFHRATQDEPSRIGNQNYFMVNSHIGHDCVIGNNITFVNGTLIAGHVRIDDHAIFGGNATIHQFCHVGRMAMVSGLSGIGKDLPPFCISYTPRSLGSLNIVGLRRAGYRDNIRPLKKAFNNLFCQELPRLAACDLADTESNDDPLANELIQFVRNSERGVVKYLKRHGKED